MQQLCPGLRSLHLVLEKLMDSFFTCRMDTRLSKLLPEPIEQLHLETAMAGYLRSSADLHPAALTSLSSLRRLSLTNITVGDLNQVLSMPHLDSLDMRHCYCEVDGRLCSVNHWLYLGHCTAPRHLTKLIGLYIQHLESDALDAAPVLTALSGVRKLAPVYMACSPASCVQQLSSLRGLQHLSLAILIEAASDAAAAVSALSSTQQLTYLSLHGRIQVQRSTWAAVLPQLTQLQVLGVGRRLLVEGLAAELPRLPQLQCLYVEDWANEGGWDPAATAAQVVPHLQVLSQCSRLKAVLCWGLVTEEDAPAAQPLWVCQHEGRLHLSCWHKWRRAAEQGWVVCPRACPHLPGVLELQQQEQATGLGSG
jgi:hypothetical protein